MNFFISIQFLNQFDKNPRHVLQIVGLVFVELVLEDEPLCYHILQLLRILCTACYKSSLLLKSHLADPAVHLYPQSSTRAPTSNVRMVIFLRSRRGQYMCSHPIHF